MDAIRRVCTLILCGLLVATTAVPAVSDYTVYADDQKDVVVDEDSAVGKCTEEESECTIEEEQSEAPDIVAEPKAEAVPGTDDESSVVPEDGDVAEAGETLVTAKDVPEVLTGDEPEVKPEEEPEVTTKNAGEPSVMPKDEVEPYETSYPADGELDGLTNNIKRIEWYRDSSDKVYAKIFGDFSEYRSKNVADQVDHFEAWINRGGLWVWDGKADKVAYPGVCTSAKFEPGETLKVYFYGAIEDGRCLWGEGDYPETPWTVTVPDFPPEFYNAQSLKVTSIAVKTANIVWDVDSFGVGKWPSGYYVYVDGKYVKKTSYWNDRNAEITIPYNKSVNVYVRSFFTDDNGKTWLGKPSNTISVKGKTIGNAGISRITKLSNGKVCIHVTKPSGATGVVVYKGSKKIKTLKSGGSFKYSAKNAGKASYKARAYIASGGKNYYSAYTKLKKPLANTAYWSSASKHDPNDPSYRYPSVHFYISKLYYSKGILKATGYIYNTRIFDLKASKIRVSVSTEGKTITRTVTVKTKVRDYSKKKITISLGKQSAYDLRGAGWTTNCVKNKWLSKWE